MSGSAVAMMIVAILIVWGGLAVAIWNLNVRSGPHRADDVHRDL